jgi:hypothetical protein
MEVEIGDKSDFGWPSLRSGILNTLYFSIKIKWMAVASLRHPLYPQCKSIKTAAKKGYF